MLPRPKISFIVFFSIDGVLIFNSFFVSHRFLRNEKCLNFPKINYLKFLCNAPTNCTSGALQLFFYMSMSNVELNLHTRTYVVRSYVDGSVSTRQKQVNFGKYRDESLAVL